MRVQLRGQSEAVGALILAFMILFMLIGANIILRQQAQIIRYNMKLADIISRRQMENLAFDYRDGVIYTIPSTEMDVLAVVAYNDTSVVYVNTSRVHLSVNQWTPLVTDPRLASDIFNLKYVLGAVTSSGNFLTWVPPVTVEKAVFAGRLETGLSPYLFNESTLYLAYHYEFCEDCYPMYTVRASTPLAALVVFHQGPAEASPSLRVAVSSTSTSAYALTAWTVEQNLTLSFGNSYYRLVYRHTTLDYLVWSVYERGRKTDYARQVGNETSAAITAAGTATLAVVCNDTAGSVQVSVYSVAGARFIPLAVYVDSGRFTSGYFYPSLVVHEPLSNTSLRVELPWILQFSTESGVSRVSSARVLDLVVAIVVNSASSTASLRLVPATAITHVSTAGYSALPPPLQVRYSDSTVGEAAASLNASSWSIGVSDPWIPEYRWGDGGWVVARYSAWTSATVNASNVPVVSSIRHRQLAAQQQPAPAPPQPPPAPPRPPPDVRLYSILDPLPGENATGVDVYVVSTKQDPNLRARFVVVNEETNATERSGEVQFSYIDTPLGAYWGFKVSLDGGARRRAVVEVLYGSFTIATYTFRNYRTTPLP